MIKSHIFSSISERNYSGELKKLKGEQRVKSKLVFTVRLFIIVDIIVLVINAIIGLFISWILLCKANKINAHRIIITYIFIWFIIICYVHELKFIMTMKLRISILQKQIEEKWVIYDNKKNIEYQVKQDKPDNMTVIMFKDIPQIEELSIERKQENEQKSKMIEQLMLEKILNVR